MFNEIKETMGKTDNKIQEDMKEAADEKSAKSKRKSE